MRSIGIGVVVGRGVGDLGVDVVVVAETEVAAVAAVVVAGTGSAEPFSCLRVKSLNVKSK